MDVSPKNVYKENTLTKIPSNTNNVKLTIRYNNFITIRYNNFICIYYLFIRLN